MTLCSHHVTRIHFVIDLEHTYTKNKNLVPIYPFDIQFHLPASRIPCWSNYPKPGHQEQESSIDIYIWYSVSPAYLAYSPLEQLSQTWWQCQPHLSQFLCRLDLAFSLLKYSAFRLHTWFYLRNKWIFPWYKRSQMVFQIFLWVEMVQELQDFSFVWRKS